ncbi:MAG TPA: sensor histidine kinase [Pseudomonadota bacterium]|nr:sensor histidine kinase [Xanthomonadales bacterium]HQW63599.1 sensor histidine kinase [Pseudomonadota bacterium]MBP7417821.1 sensor histidine kinase [Xanthomonadales bacterium]MBP8176308.1 sensor histidine kinase [Xanthomonadales bacterium]HQX24828.1 sensor histidine kinase [Pseudomonadota bacterium]
MKRDEPPRNAPDPALVRDQLARLRAEQERLFAQLADGEQHFRQLARSVWRVQEEERRRLARELHDGIGQHLTALRHRLESLAAGARESTDIARALELCAQALEETRALSRLLRPQILDDLGLVPALRWLGRSMGEAAGLEIVVDAGPLPEPLDGDLSTLVFRVVQEALTNAVKHAGARQVVVRLALRGDALQLLVVDDGRGCELGAAFSAASSGQATGMSSMRERVRLFGGRFDVDSRPGEGLQIRVALPLPPSGSSA